MAVLAQSLGGPSETRGDLGQNEFTLWLSPQYFRPVTESGCSALLGGSSEVAATAEDVKVVQFVFLVGLAGEDRLPLLTEEMRQSLLGDDGLLILEPLQEGQRFTSHLLVRLH